MQTFHYTAVNVRGESQAGQIEATDEKQAVEILRDRNLVITSVKLKEKKVTFDVLSFFQIVPISQKIFFTRQLATMLASGVSLTHSLGILQQQTQNKVFEEVIRRMIMDIDAGASLHQAMSRHPQVFDRLYLSLVRAGEASGTLEEVLNKLADSISREANFKSKVKGALIYPSIIVVVMLGVLLIMVFFVIPRLSTLYEEMDIELPIYTRMLLKGSKFALNYWWLMLLAVLVLFGCYKQVLRNLKFQYWIADFQFRLPVFGGLAKEVQLTSFTRTLSTLISAGLPILEAIDIAKDTLTNIRFIEGIVQAGAMVEKGKTFSEPLRHDPNFPPILSEMIAVGEETGKLEEVLEKISGYFEEESDNTLKNLTSALEPIIMVILGVGVAFLIVTLILPIYTLTSQF